MKFNIKKSLDSILSLRQVTERADEASLPVQESKGTASADNRRDYERAFANSDMPVALLDKITELINKTIPDIILNTIDKEAEKREIYEYLLPSFADYINFISRKIRDNGDVVFTDMEIKSREKIEELENKLNCALQREEDYKGRYLSAERQKRALSDKAQELEQRIERSDSDREKSDSQRIDLNNKLRALSQQKSQAEEESERLRLELEQVRQMQENSALMRVGVMDTEDEYVESLKNTIIKLQTETGEVEEKLASSEAKIKEVTRSFETALHLKEETVMQAVEREAMLQARIDDLLRHQEGETVSEDKDDEMTLRLVEITRKYQALQTELSKYKAKAYDEASEDMQRRIDDLTAQLNHAKAKLVQAESGEQNPGPVLENAQRQIEELRDKLLKSDDATKRLELALSEANTKIYSLNSQISSLSEAASAGMTLEEQRELRERLVESQVAEKSRENELSSALEKIVKLQEKIDKQAAANESKRSSRQIEDLKDKLTGAEREVEKLRKELSVSVLNVKALSNEVELLKSDEKSSKTGSTIDIIDDDWLVVMEPETEEEILERRDKEIERQRQEEAEKDKTIPFEDPAQMKLW